METMLTSQFRDCVMIRMRGNLARDSGNVTAGAGQLKFRLGIAPALFYGFDKFFECLLVTTHNKDTYPFIFFIQARPFPVSRYF